MNQRPSDFRMDYQASLAKGLVFAGLGRHPKSLRYTDSSLFKNTGTLTGMDPPTDWLWSAELGRWVLDFDGSNDRVLGSNLVLAAPYALATWLACGGGNNAFQTALAVGADGHQIRVDTRDEFNQDNIEAVVRTSTWVTINGPTVVFGDYYHAALTVASDGTASLYVNGAWYGGSASVPVSQTGVVVGDYKSTGDRPWLGTLSDPLIYNRALTPSEIQQLADPSNVMLSGLILPPRRRVWPSAVVPLSLPDYADVSNESPFEDDESIATVAATGGSTPYSYAITAQSTTAGMLKVTGTLNPDATGIYTENGTYNGVPAYERSDGTYWIWFNDSAVAWVITTAKGSYAAGWYLQDDGLPVTGEYTAYNTTGTATVALYAPFAINSSTGEITITDPSGLAVGQTWTITVQVTDALTDTDTGTVTVELTAGAGVVFVRRINQRFLATGSYGAAQVQV